MDTACLSVPDTSFISVDIETIYAAKAAVDREAQDPLTVKQEQIIVRCARALPKPLCPIYRFPDGTPCLCKCTEARGILGISGHLCRSTEHCIVLVVVSPHHYGGKRLP